MGDVDIEVPKGAYEIDYDAAVGDSDVDGLSRSDRAQHTIDAQADVGTVDITASR